MRNTAAQSKKIEAATREFIDSLTESTTFSEVLSEIRRTMQCGYTQVARAVNRLENKRLIIRHSEGRLISAKLDNLSIK